MSEPNITSSLNQTDVTVFFSTSDQLLVSERRLIDLLNIGNPFAAQPFEACTFVPGTYYHVFQDGEEIDPDSDFNLWLKGQFCVGCRFNFSRKKPSVIKAHVKSCAARSAHYDIHYAGFDPLKVVCQWMTY